MSSDVKGLIIVSALAILLSFGFLLVIQSRELSQDDTREEEFEEMADELDDVSGDDIKDVAD